MLRASARNDASGGYFCSMNRKIRLLVLAVVAAIVAYTLYDSVEKAPEVDPAAFRRAELERRRDKDQFFRESADSPLPDRATFTGLRYFDPDPAYRVTATVEKLSAGPPYRVQMTRGETETYQPYGRAIFTLDGKTYRLLVFRSAEKDQLFVPFKDMTNGGESYGAGRYLDVPLSEVSGDELPLDFNRAYNPFCAYNPTYTCPIPPAENHLKVAVAAGEKALEGH